MKYEVINNSVKVSDIKCIDIELCLFCGQAFRWKKREDGSFHGVVDGKVTDIVQKENEIIFLGTSEEDFLSLWCDYFDLESDYESAVKKFDEDKNLSAAVKEYYGIRILHQKPWEALCSFIISQNNNIPRIMGIIDRLCETFGDKTGENDYTFPSYEKIGKLTAEDLAPLRAGFRNKYIIDAARKLCSGEINLEEIKNMPIEQARNELMKIKGVGAKVAECTLLYGFGRKEAFPIDVWVKKIMAEMYPDGLPECTKDIEGIAQQYLFHWRRNSPEFKNKE
ncbi:MAG: DNA-3-methyladenine glycosylase 2 family protein [Clostridia bacterium]|nr:DNA-3-methyladenine glycosylase 2 family protein [Clostridia bacterium]